MAAATGERLAPRTQTASRVQTVGTSTRAEGRCRPQRAASRTGNLAHVRAGDEGRCVRNDACGVMRQAEGRAPDKAKKASERHFAGPAQSVDILLVHVTMFRRAKPSIQCSHK